jgi:short-subunit dehydrogenase
MKKFPKICWVTGAGSGIGHAIAAKLASEGHRVYISGRDQARLEKTSREIAGELIPLPCQVGDDAGMACLLVDQGIPHLDLVVINAGTCEYIELPDLDIKACRRVAETNYFGVINTCIAALPLLQRAASMPGRAKPQIIGIGSQSSLLGLPRAEAYGSSKAAMSYFLDSLRTDIDGQIDVTVVYPGFIRTPMTDQNDFPMPFLLSAEKAADIILSRAAKRPLRVMFPYRLYWLLKVLNIFSRLWYFRIAPRLSRQQEMNT